MSLFYKKSANILLEQGHKPTGFIDVSGVPYAGFGKFSQLSYSYQYPLSVTLVKGQLACSKWVFDNTDVVYTLTCNGKSRSRYHGTLEELFHSSQPYIFKLNMSDVKKCLDNGIDFEFNDNSYDNYKVVISNKTENKH